jgi:phosphoribosylamine--glycine ligase
MKVLVIGSGGREHALAWKIAQSPRVDEVLVAPGNAGTVSEAKCRNVASTARTSRVARAGGARRHRADGRGPRRAARRGRRGSLPRRGHRIFGPTAAAAQLEGSKAFAKDFLARHGIPTAHYAVHTKIDEALAYVRAKGAPIVVKADGLAAGKGVIVAMTLAEAEHAIDDMLAGKPSAPLARAW